MSKWSIIQICFDGKIVDSHYTVSDKGEVINTKRGNVLTPHVNSNGYKSVILSIKNIKYKFYLHRLIATYFIEKEDETFDVVNHINGNKLDNSLDNLEWTSQKGNSIHAWKTGLIDNKGDNNGNSKLTWEDVRFIRDYHSAGCLQKDLCEALKISAATVSQIVNNKSWMEEN